MDDPLESLIKCCEQWAAHGLPSEGYAIDRVRFGVEKAKTERDLLKAELKRAYNKIDDLRVFGDGE